MCMGKPPFGKAYVLCDGSGQCIQLDEVDHMD